MKIKNTGLKIIKGDITELSCDAIVNAANHKLLMGGGVAGVIRKKGGQEIEDEAVKKGPIEIGGALATGAGRLKAKYVIHAATMGMDFQTDEHKIRQACANAFKCAEKLNLESIAFPALGCGVGHFPLVGAAKIMAQEILKHFRNPSTIKEVVFCLYDEEAFRVFDKDAPPSYYRNQFLAQAMVNLNMIDTVGSGIKKMFFLQRDRHFPLPTYELDKANEVSVRISGKILDK